MEDDDRAPWTPQELTDLRHDLVRTIEELRRSIDAGTMPDLSCCGDAADHAQGIVEHGLATLDTDRQRLMLEQAEHALGRLDGGLHGWCESCEGPIGRQRLAAAPRATTCITCA